MNSHLPILVVDDDSEDTQLLVYAFKEAGIKNPVSFVNDGEELFKFLNSSEGSGGILPGLIFLDLKLPKISGQEVLKLMKEHPKWRRVPVLVFSTSDFKEDIAEVYSLGAAGYIVKPLSYAKLLAVVKAIKTYWVESVTLS